mmetsp:Transcript_7150/g.17898  ORF Transcript_7150/g.17898 Transcript_7150/m.17898 type:complete len:205 (+) Transcript_7150:268-882(+)
MHDVHSNLKIGDAAEVHLYAPVRHLSGVLHVIHQRTRRPEDAIHALVGLLVLYVGHATRTPVYVEQRRPELRLPSPHDAVVRVYRVALRAILLEVLRSPLDISRRQFEIVRDVIECIETCRRHRRAKKKPALARTPRHLATPQERLEPKWLPANGHVEINLASDERLLCGYGSTQQDQRRPDTTSHRCRIWPARAKPKEIKSNL